jgi:hypothetical protein
MNAINETRPTGDVRHSGSRRPAEERSAAVPPAVEHTLRRTGRKPVRFEGWQLIEAVGPEGRAQIWYDLNLYRTVADSIVVELVARRRVADDQDLFHVKTFPDLAAASVWLEAYRCAEDVSVPADLLTADTALPWAVLQAMQLRQRLDRIETDYHALLSEVFDALDLTDPVDAAASMPREIATA